MSRRERKSGAGERERVEQKRDMKVRKLQEAKDENRRRERTGKERTRKERKLTKTVGNIDLELDTNEQHWK